MTEAVIVKKILKIFLYSIFISLFFIFLDIKARSLRVLCDIRKPDKHKKPFLPHGKKELLNRSSHEKGQHGRISCDPNVLTLRLPCGDMNIQESVDFYEGSGVRFRGQYRFFGKKKRRSYFFLTEKIECCLFWLILVFFRGKRENKQNFVE